MTLTVDKSEPMPRFTSGARRSCPQTAPLPHPRFLSNLRRRRRSPPPPPTSSPRPRPHPHLRPTSLLISSIHPWKPPFPRIHTPTHAHPWMDGWMGRTSSGDGDAGSTPTYTMEAGRIGIHRLLSVWCGTADHTGDCYCGGHRRRRISGGT